MRIFLKISILFICVVALSAARAESCYSLKKTLAIGQMDASVPGEIANLQRFLKEQGSTIEVTGFFSKKTEQELMSFQATQFLPRSGRTDSATLRRIFDLSCGKQILGRETTCQSTMESGNVRIPVLMYHWVCDGNEPECFGANKDLYVSSKQLREQMSALAKAGFHCFRYTHMAL